MQIIPSAIHVNQSKTDCHRGILGFFSESFGQMAAIFCCDKDFRFFHSLAPPVTNKSRQRLCLCATLLPVSLDTGRGVWGQSPMFLNHSTVEIHRNS